MSESMNSLKTIEVSANVATIALALFLGWTALHGSFTRLATSGQAASVQLSGPKVGFDLKQTPLKDINWAGRTETLVLGLQTTCHFCTESAPFFQKLVSAGSGRVEIVAVLPQSVDDSTKYLSKLRVHVDEIRSASLSSIGVIGTPTMMLVDDKGLVRKVWVGKLPDERQAEVLAAITR